MSKRFGRNQRRHMREEIAALNAAHRDATAAGLRIELDSRYAQPVGYALPADHRWTERDVNYLANHIAREMCAHLNKEQSK